MRRRPAASGPMPPTGTPRAAALRLPYDAAAYPSAPAVVATYSVQPPSVEALADALFGRVPFEGRLPVTVPGA